MIKIFGREPVYWLSGLQALFAVLVTLPVIGDVVTPDVTAWVIMAGTAILAAWEAWAVRPLSVVAMSNAVKVTLTALVLFGFQLPPGLEAGLIALGTFIIGSLMTTDVTPRAFPDLDWLASRELTGGSTGTGSHRATYHDPGA